MDPDVEDVAFGKQITVFLAQSEKQLEKTLERNKVVAEKYSEICDMFLIGKEDPLRKKSEEFFKFWTGFIDDIQKNIPKPQKAPTKAVKKVA